LPFHLPKWAVFCFDFAIKNRYSDCC